MDDPAAARAPVARTTGPRRPRHALVAGGTALVVLAGLLLFSAHLRGPDLAAVRQAVDALFVTPAVHVRNSSADGTIRADLLVTATGEAVGELVVDGRTYEFLDVDDQHWLRSPDGTLPGGPLGAQSDPPAAELAAELLAGRWVAVDLDALDRGWQVPPAPPGIAARLRSALADPGAVELDGDGPVVAGEPTVVVRTPLTDLHVAQRSPHRVLRISPRRGGGHVLGLVALRGANAGFALGDAGATRSPSGSPVPPGGGELDVTGLDPDRVEQVYDEVRQRVPQLAEAADASLRLAFSTGPSLRCGPTGCSIEASVTATVLPPGRSSSSTGLATLAVDASIEGQAAGRCDEQVALTLDTPTPIGCTIPEAGAVWSRAREAKKAAAVAVTPPGGTARWKTVSRARAVVVGRVDVDVTSLQRVVDSSAEETACLTDPDACPDPAATPPPPAATRPGTPSAAVAALSPTIDPVRQGRHVRDDPRYAGGGYFLGLQQAQQVLDAVRSGAATVLGRTRGGHLLVRYDAVTGYNMSPPRYFDQPTNVFAIKGTRRVSVFPTSPTARPAGQP